MVGKATRAYHSPLRAAQAEATRAAILGAAVVVFSERGYTGTTMRAVAAEAGVAVESVYALASKARLLELAFERAVTGDEHTGRADLPFAEQVDFQAALHAPDQREQLRLFGLMSIGPARRVAAISRAFMQASVVDEDLGKRWREQEERRYADMRTFVAAVAANGPLRPGLTVDAAARDVWSTLNWYTIWLLLRERHPDGGVFDDQAFAGWVERTVAALLLPD
ncbi:transcriptional regulator, tetR family [Frankia sp. EI5c]|uniref:TetR/AcrR family transcriptional regulator n=1 Tax=Frankia sp. EI5c TaxID=683316 RepID=UPI0007C22065|nr:TetR family transcriptional regulator [Frankia sp. EI5c]OAA27380.1 transcriptional regulator, tetR family [Frankia sp. EI5c]